MQTKAATRSSLLFRVRVSVESMPRVRCRAMRDANKSCNPVVAIVPRRNTQRGGTQGDRRTPTLAPRATPPAYAWGVTHSKWNLLRRIEHGNTVTAADRAVCPQGHRSAAQGGGQCAQIFFNSSKYHMPVLSETFLFINKK